MKKTLWISKSYLTRQSYQGYRCKLGIAITAIGGSLEITLILPLREVLCISKFNIIFQLKQRLPFFIFLMEEKQINSFFDVNKCFFLNIEYKGQCTSFILKRVYAKNERGYRLIPNLLPYQSLLVVPLSFGSKSRKWQKIGISNISYSTFSYSNISYSTFSYSNISSR